MSGINVKRGSRSRVERAFVWADETVVLTGSRSKTPSRARSAGAGSIVDVAAEAVVVRRKRAMMVRRRWRERAWAQKAGRRVVIGLAGAGE